MNEQIGCPGCGTAIEFVELGVYEDGKLIPIEGMLVPHPFLTKKGMCSNKSCKWSKVKE